MGSLSYCLQKSNFLKLIISCFHYFRSQNWYQWIWVKKINFYFFYFWFKNKRRNPWHGGVDIVEKMGKKRKNSKNLKIADNYPNIAFIFSIIFPWKIKIINCKNFDFCKALRPPLVQFSKFNNCIWFIWFSCKNVSNFVSLVLKLLNR